MFLGTKLALDFAPAIESEPKQSRREAKEESAGKNDACPTRKAQRKASHAGWTIGLLLPLRKRAKLSRALSSEFQIDGGASSTALVSVSASMQAGAKTDTLVSLRWGLPVRGCTMGFTHAAPMRFLEK